MIKRLFIIFFVALSCNAYASEVWSDGESYLVVDYLDIKKECIFKGEDLEDRLNGGAVGGPDKSIQFNDNNIFGGDGLFTFDKTNKELNFYSSKLKGTGDQTSGGTVELVNKEQVISYEGKAVKLNGINQYIEIPHSASLVITGAFSVEAWVNPTSFDAYRAIVVKLGNAYTKGFSLEKRTLGGVALWVATGSAYYHSYSSADIPTNQWTHIVGVYDGTYIKVYINGSQSGTPTLSPPPADNTAPIHIGWNAVGSEPQRFWNGIVDEVRLYKRALTDAEILEHYNSGNGQYGQPEPGLGSGWHLDEGSGTTANDYSGNNNTGTLKNSPVWVTGKVVPTEIPGKAVRFDGTNDYIRILSSPDTALENNLSVTFWAKYISPGNYVYAICKKNSHWAQTTGYLSYFYVGTPGYIDMIGRGDAFKRHNISSDGNWHHYALVWQGITWLVYQDANLLSGTMYGTPQPVIAGTDELWIGRRDAGTGGYTAGLIDEVKLYNIALTQAQITADYNAGKGVYGQPEPNLRAGWHLDEGTGITTNDYSGNGNIGHLSGGALWEDGKIMLPGGGPVIETRYAFKRGCINNKNRLLIGDVNDNEIVINKPLLKSPVLNTAGKTAFILDTENQLTETDTKLLDIRNYGVSKFSVNKDGGVSVPGPVGINTAPQRRLHVFQPGNDWSARFQTGAGYIDFGPTDTNYAHISTDLPRFAFNKTITITQNPAVIEAYGNNPMRFWVGGDYRLSILSDGKVGVATITPPTIFAAKGLTATTGGYIIRYMTDTGGFYYLASSEKYKKDIKDFKDDFLKILQAKPKSFVDKETGESGIGYIAEDFDRLGLKNLVGYNEKGEADRIDYEMISLYLVEIVKDQQKQLDFLKKIIYRRR